MNPRTQLRLKRRWKRWEPWVILWLKQTGQPQSTISRLEASHRAFLERCLKLGMDNHFHFIRSLERNQLDDPRVTEEERERRLQKFLRERRK